MTDPLDRLEAVTERLAYRAKYEQDNRRGLLWIHALMGMLAGFQMGLWGTATNLERYFGPNIRYVMMVIGITGGMMLASGLLRRPRHIPLEVGGLALVGLWDLCMSGGLLYARLKQDNYAVLEIGEPIAPGYVSAYPITVYAGLGALICVHLWTLRKLHHPRKLNL